LFHHVKKVYVLLLFSRLINTVFIIEVQVRIHVQHKTTWLKSTENRKIRMQRRKKWKKTTMLDMLVGVIKENKSQ